MGIGRELGPSFDCKPIYRPAVSWAQRRLLSWISDRDASLTDLKGTEHLRSNRRERRVLTILDCWAAVLPARIVKEDLGDYIEDIKHRCADGQRIRVWLRALAATFWTGVNSIGYAMTALGKRQAG
jgi:hypothetical protein